MSLVRSREPDTVPPASNVAALAPGSIVGLDSAQRFWLVAEGRFEVYAALAQRRHFLAELGPGAILFGGGLRPGELIALAPDGGRLRALDPASIAQTAADPLRAAEVIGPLDGWLTRLSDGVARHAPPRPQAWGAQANEQLAPSANPVVSSARGVLWLGAQGDLAMSYLGRLRMPPQMPMALTPATWGTIEGNGMAIGAATFALLRNPAWPQAIAHFHALIGAVVANWGKAVEAAEVARIEEREDMTAADLAAAKERLVAVLTESGAPKIEPPSDAAFVVERIVPKAQALPAHMVPPEDLRAYAEARGLRTRTINLSGEWWRHDKGALVALRVEDRRPVALLTDWRGGYRVHARGESAQKVDAKVAATLEPEAIALLQPLPNRPIQWWELVLLGLRLCRADLSTLVIASFAASLLGLVLPLAMGEVVDTFVPDQLRTPTFRLGIALAFLTLCSSLLRVCSDLARLRMDGRLSTVIQAGVMDRVLRLPSRLLKSAASADLSLRVLSVEQMRRTVTNTALNTLLSGLFGLSGFVLLFFYSPPTAFLAVGLFGLVAGIAAAAGLGQLKALATGEAMTANVTSLTLQIIQNVSVLRSFGAEQRAFTRWARNIAAMRSRSLRSRYANSAFETFIASYDGLALAAVFAVLGFAAGADRLSLGSYLAFIATYQSFLGSSEGLARAMVQIIGMRPTLKRAELLLGNAPENPPMAKDPGELSGLIEISNVSFAYAPGGRQILSEVSFPVERGKFVAIVGPSGSGKSTLMNLILGFDQPLGGTVLFDGQDFAKLDRTAVRRQIGVVRQGGRLLAGSIFENIVGIHQGTVEDAWAAAGLAGIADDIRALPMGMHTVLTEGVSTFSGGQVQRLLLARALVGRPKILMLDEATSALDNVAQASIMENVERLGITRIVVAHRLSTIRNADTIHFLENGKLVESGSFEELVKLDKRFGDFARRQQL